MKSILLGALVFALIFMIVTYTKEPFLFKKKTTSDPKLNELKEKLKILFDKDNYFTGKLSMLNKRDLLNEINIYPGNKSYTLNKKDTYMCMKDKKTGNYYSDNTLMYVLLHELAHSLNTENVGHTQEWNDIFEELLEYATSMGLYDPSQEVPLDYCK